MDLSCQPNVSVWSLDPLHPRTITQNLVKNANSWTQLQTYWIINSEGGAQLSVSTSLPSDSDVCRHVGKLCSMHTTQLTFSKVLIPLPCLCIEFLICLSLFLVKSCLHSKGQFETLLFPWCHSWSWHYLVFLPGTNHLLTCISHLIYLSCFPH